MTDTHCKICDKQMEFGDSFVLHIFQEHPRQFVNILIELNPKLVSMMDIFYETRS